MITIWIEVHSAYSDGFFMSDWTYWFDCWYHNGDYRAYNTWKVGFEAVIGKSVTYMIKGLKNSEHAKQFAIWYHVNKSSGNIGTYRLD